MDARPRSWYHTREVAALKDALRHADLLHANLYELSQLSAQQGHDALDDYLTLRRQDLDELHRFLDAWLHPRRT